MTIQIGDRIPNVVAATMTSTGQKGITTDEVFADKRVVMFAVPGVFTPTCSAAHLPGYVVHYDAFIEKGVDTIACLSVNDAFVMGAWAEAQNVRDSILMIADGNAAITQALGLEFDLTENHMGIRSQRYALVAEEGVVTHLNIDPSELAISNAETILGLL